MEAVIKINLDNAAFADGNSGNELARILRKLADRVDTEDVIYGPMSTVLVDLNGNKVGSFEIRAASLAESLVHEMSAHKCPGCGACYRDDSFVAKCASNAHYGRPVRS